MNNLFAFHGIDHKVGVTMTAQSVAELIASQNTSVSVLFISLNGRKNCEFVKEEVKTIDDFKLQLDSQMLIGKDFLRDCRHNKNFYFLAGLSNEQDERYYFPDSAKYLLESISNSFEIIIADTGSELDNGLALGGMSIAARKYLVLNQLESNLSRYEKMAPWFEKAQVDFDGFIINKFYEEDSYSLKYITERLYVKKEQTFKIHAVGYERQAEIEHKTLMKFKTDNYIEDIAGVANDVLENVGLPQIKLQRKGKLWRNFI